MGKKGIFFDGEEGEKKRKKLICHQMHYLVIC